MKSLETSRANRKSFWNLESPIPYHSDSPYNENLSPVSINSTAGPSGNILPDHENVANADAEDNNPTIKWVHSDISDAPVITTFSSDVESLKKGIIKTSKNRANMPYTILLVGETGVGKSSVLEFIANVLTGNDIDHFNFNILDRTNERGGSDNQSQTNAPRLYEFTSKNGIMVSPGALKCGGYSLCNLFPRFASSTLRDWPTLAVYSEMNSTRGELRPRSRSTSTPSLPFSSLPMVPYRASQSVLTTHSPLYPPCSQNPWPKIFPLCSPMS